MNQRYISPRTKIRHNSIGIFALALLLLQALQKGSCFIISSTHHYFPSSRHFKPKQHEKQLANQIVIATATISVTEDLLEGEGGNEEIDEELITQTAKKDMIAQSGDEEKSKPKFDISILYEDENVLAIDKPHNISHHNEKSNQNEDEELGILSYIRNNPSSIPYKNRLYGVHRLDKVTSGILIFAKNAQTAGLLQKSFREKAVTKYYIALSFNKPKKKKQGWIKGDMARARRGMWKLTKSMKDPAVTRFFTAGLGELNSLLPKDVGEGKSNAKTLILFQPHTGRTHQLRVAAKSIGLPILGDPYYASVTSSDNDVKPSNGRTYLHAAALHLNLEGKDIVIWSPPPFLGHWTSSLSTAKEGKKNDSTISAEFDRIVKQTMAKYCDDDMVLDLIRKKEE